MDDFTAHLETLRYDYFIGTSLVIELTDPNGHVASYESDNSNDLIDVYERNDGIDMVGLTCELRHDYSFGSIGGYKVVVQFMAYEWGQLFYFYFERALKTSLSRFSTTANASA